MYDVIKYIVYGIVNDQCISNIVLFIICWKMMYLVSEYTGDYKGNICKQLVLLFFLIVQKVKSCVIVMYIQQVKERQYFNMVCLIIVYVIYYN